MSDIIKAVIGVVAAVIVINVAWGLLTTAISAAITVAIVGGVAYLIYRGIRSLGSDRRREIGH